MNIIAKTVYILVKENVLEKLLNLTQYPKVQPHHSLHECVPLLRLAEVLEAVIEGGRHVGQVGHEV